MWELNLGAHRCGSGGYRGKQPTWDKEDAEMIRLGKEKPWLRIVDLQTRNYVRSRYYLDWKTGEFIMDYPDMKKFEKFLVRIVYIIALILLGNEAKWANLKFLCLKDDELKASSTAGPSSQGSMEPWDMPFNRATNAYKKRNLDKPPTSAGRVSGFGTSMKVSEYYGSDAKTRKERRTSTKDKAEVQELKKKVESLEKIVDPTEMSKLLDERLWQIIPPGLMEGLAAWNSAGQQGPIYVPSVSGNNSSLQVSLLVTEGFRSIVNQKISYGCEQESQDLI
jgi:hypothetical protein